MHNYSYRYGIQEGGAWCLVMLPFGWILMRPSYFFLFFAGWRWIFVAIGSQVQSGASHQPQISGCFATTWRSSSGWVEWPRPSTPISPIARKFGGNQAGPSPHDGPDQPPQCDRRTGFRIRIWGRGRRRILCQRHPAVRRRKKFSSSWTHLCSRSLHGNNDFLFTVEWHRL